LISARAFAIDLAWMIQSGLRIALVAAVLLQYTPLRICAFERVATGSNCHDRAETVGDVAHADEQGCGVPTDGEHGCQCERPKLQGDHYSFRADAIDAAAQAINFTAEPLRAQLFARGVEADPPRAHLPSLQIPLLS
jgi:hypothetical protein